MRRTYRSKKDTGGALDHRDVLQNMDEKSSAFDAFYIQNIKQTKRELSCVGTSNALATASNRVRKKKYVKRIVKVVETVRPRESMSASTYLTPDKSIRVNKILDPFDMLLNSSSNGQVANRSSAVQNFIATKPGNSYTRKKVKAVKKFNYSSEYSSDSDKENTTNTQSNTTDIRAHKLVVERLHSSPINFDESINKIVNNISLLNNLQRKTANNSFNTSYKQRNRLTKNCQSLIFQNSPLCSTPFKEKYRGKSIYIFSPISTKSYESPNNCTLVEEKSDSNNSFVLLCRKKHSELSIKEASRLTYDTPKDNVVRNIEEKSLIYDDIEALDIPETEIVKDKVSSEEKSVIYDDIAAVPDLCENVNDTDAMNLNKNSELPSEQSLMQITQAEPLYGFTNNRDNEIIVNEHNYLLQFIEHNKGNESLDKTDEHDPDDNEYRSKDKGSFKDDSNGGSLKNLKGDNSRSNNISDAIDLQHSETSILSNNISSSNHENLSDSFHDSDNKSMYDTCNSEQSVTEEKIYNIEPKVTIERLNDSVFIKYYEKLLLDKEDSSSGGSNWSHEDDNEVEETDDENDDSDSVVLNETVNVNENLTSENGGCNSDQSVTEEKKNNFEPKVTIERLNDSLFIKYYVKLLDKKDSTSGGSIEDDNEVQETDDENDDSDILNEDLNVNANLTSENGTSVVNTSSTSITSKTESYCVENLPIEILITDSSTTEDNVESNDETSASEEAHVSFVTTRRRHEFTNDSMFIFDNSYGSSRTDCDKTVLSNKARLSCHNKSDSESDVSIKDDNKIDVLYEKKIHDSKVRKHRMTRKGSRLSRQSNVKPVMDSSIKSTIVEAQVVEDSSDDNKIHCKQKESPKTTRSLVTTRKSSRIFNDSLIPNRSSINTDMKPSIVLQPGKKWERSLSIYRRMTTMADHFDSSFIDDDGPKKGRKYRQSVISTMEMQDSLHNESINSRRSTFISKPSRSTIRFVKDSNSSRISLNTTEVFDDLKGFLNEECDDTVIELSKLSLADSEFEVTVLDNFNETSERIATAREYVLRRCNQTEPLLFDECYPETTLKNCHKIGEGVYGEVFLWRGRDGRARVMKIVPIAGTVKVNGEAQKDFHEVISEIVIAMELSALRAPIAEIDRYFDEGKDVESLDLHSVENATDVFNEVLAVRCVQGPYPSRLLDLWELYDECKGSENDNPAALPADQQYIVLELANAGQDLESYQFTGAQQAHALFQQIAFGLAVGEESFQFEHRDLHWGNVLIAPTEQKLATFVLNGRSYRVPRGGVCATIIDYSLSRVSLPLAAERAALYNDLARDDQLFDAVGDYQFQVYRLMRDKLGNDWKNFEPYTNILWLHYTVDKMITALRYKRTTTKIHKHYIEKLKGIKERILAYKSATEYVITDIEI